MASGAHAVGFVAESEETSVAASALECRAVEGAGGGGNGVKGVKAGALLAPSEPAEDGKASGCRARGKRASDAAAGVGPVAAAWANFR